MANAITINVLSNTRGLSRGLATTKGQLTAFESAGIKVGNKLGRMFAGAVKSVATLGAAFLGTAIVKGGQRLIGIDQAQAKLRGLGHDADTVSAIMENALAAVKGTAFGLDEAATQAASAVAAGIQPGRELEGYLRLVADAATIAGTDLGEMGQIINKVTATGKAMTENLNQLSERGIPILGWLADEFGVTTEEMSKMVSQGKVDAETFRKVLEDNIGGAALESGETLKGGFANMMAAMGRFGAMLIGPFVGDAKNAFGAVTATIDTWAAAVQPHVETFAAWLRDEALPALQAWAATVAEQLLPKLVALGEWVRDTLVPAIADLVEFLKENEYFVGLLATVVGTLIGAWAAYSKVMQAVRAVQAAVNIVMAANPIGLVVIALSAMVAALVYAYHRQEAFRDAVDNAFRVVREAIASVIEWVRAIPRWFDDMRARVTAAVILVRTAVTVAFQRVVLAVTNAIGNVISTVRGLPGRIVAALGSLGSRLVSAGRDLIMGLIRGITGSVGRALDTVRNVGRSILSGIKGVFGIRSPSRVTRDYGLELVEGLIVGMSRLSGVRRAASGMAAAVAAGFAAPELTLDARARVSPLQGATVNLTVQVPVGADRARIGQEIVDAIREYERSAGTRWRA